LTCGHQELASNREAAVKVNLLGVKMKPRQFLAMSTTVEIGSKIKVNKRLKTTRRPILRELAACKEKVSIAKRELTTTQDRQTIETASWLLGQGGSEPSPRGLRERPGGSEERRGDCGQRLDGTGGHAAACEEGPGTRLKKVF